LFLSVDVIIPLYVEKTFNGSGKGVQLISATVISMIMVAPEFSGFFFSPVVPSISQSYGRKNIMLIGFIMCTISLVAMSFTTYIHNYHAYTWTAIALRLLLGIGDQQV